MDFLKGTMKPIDVTASLDCYAAASASPAADTVREPAINVVEVEEEAEVEPDDIPAWAQLYEGDGEWHNGHRFTWPDVPAAITGRALQVHASAERV